MKTILPRLSIVTPSFNQGQFIEQTICSVLDQGYPDLEYFVMDGGSTDGTVEILKKYEKHLSGWVSEKDRGQTHAINKGFARASGDVLAYINSDDWYLPGALHAAGEHFMAHPGAGLLHGRCVRIKGDVRHDTQFASIQTPVEILDLWNVWWKDRQFVQPEVFWSRKVAEQIGPFNESLHMVMDYEYWLRAILAGARVDGLDREVCCFRMHPGQKSGMTGKAADELRMVVQPYLWDGSVPLPAVARRRLQALWLYDGPFRMLADQSLSRGEGRLLRWAGLARFVIGHPRVLDAPPMRGRLLGWMGVAGPRECCQHT